VSSLWYGPRVAVARIAGAGLLTLSSACWFQLSAAQSRAAKGLVDAMTFYNVTVVATLTYAGIGSGLRGVRLWPAAGQTTESGVPDRQTENPQDIFDHDCTPR
jgi:hypothetical protein